MDSEQRLSDADVSLVLRRAGEMTAAQGLTVAQVQEIARDVGLEPDAVQRALAESASGALRPAAMQRSLGVPVGVNKDVMLPGVLSDEGWDVLVSVLRATFNAHGKETRSGSVREWRNGRLRVAVEPAAGGQRLRMSTLKEGALTAPMIGSVSGVVYSASLVAASTSKPALLMLAAVPAMLAAACAAWPFLTLPRWARARSTQFDAIAREAMALVNTAPALPAARVTPLRLSDS
ncbi:MAG: hypothetical protein V4813_16335 [Gemmatimonadota bacterium]